MIFDWDENKRRSNFKKHGVDFHEAATVFNDPCHISVHDNGIYDEDRFIVIGISEKSRMLMVCHCYQENDDLVRLISARKATRGEFELYGGVW
jgi:uncharacterized DUF497 family protein